MSGHTYHKVPINQRICFQCSDNSSQDVDYEDVEGDTDYDEDDNYDLYLGNQQNEHDDTNDCTSEKDDVSEDDSQQDPDAYENFHSGN